MTVYIVVPVLIVCIFIAVIYCNYKRINECCKRRKDSKPQKKSGTTSMFNTPSPKPGLPISGSESAPASDDMGYRTVHRSATVHTGDPAFTQPVARLQKDGGKISDEKTVEIVKAIERGLARSQRDGVDDHKTDWGKTQPGGNELVDGLKK
ncbi:hypothetical protein PFISCL1PPCAC_340, partial [Pristionchus fissidentatus]